MPIELKKTQNIRPKYQKELYNIIYDAFKHGKIPRNEVSPVYKVLISGNYSAWEREFRDLYENFQRDQDYSSLLSSLSKMFHQFKIESRNISTVRELNAGDLVLVGCMFLVNPSFQEWNMLGT